MDALLWLIPVALFLGGIGLIAFLWALRSGQFDDMDGAGMRILIEDERKSQPDQAGLASPEPTTPTDPKTV